MFERNIKRRTVRDHAAVIGETVLARVVGDGVVGVLCCDLAGHQGQQE